MSSVLMVGVDCSECGERAVKYAAERATESKSQIFIAHVIEWSQFTFSTIEENARRHKRREEEIQRAHSEVVDPIVNKLKSEGVDVRVP